MVTEIALPEENILLDRDLRLNFIKLQMREERYLKEVHAFLFSKRCQGFHSEIFLL